MLFKNNCKNKSSELHIFDTLEYNARKCGCGSCAHQKRGKCTAVIDSVCVDEWLGVISVNYYELLRHSFRFVTDKRFKKRLSKYMKESRCRPMEYAYRGKEHKEIFNHTVDRMDIYHPKMLSALYLLTADKNLWSKTRYTVDSDSIDFSAVRLGDISTDAYTLYMTAKDLYEGTKHISVSDIADKDIVSHKMFSVLVNAMSLRRYGTMARDTLNGDGEKPC